MPALGQWHRISQASRMQKRRDTLKWSVDAFKTENDLISLNHRYKAIFFLLFAFFFGDKVITFARLNRLNALAAIAAHFPHGFDLITIEKCKSREREKKIGK